MSALQEFKKFALQGNVMDLAVGIVIGAAFSSIVKSLVDDIITPAVLTPALKAAKLSDLTQLVIPGTAIKYGNFISSILSFIIVSFALFIVIKLINRAKKKQEEPAPPPPPAISTTDALLMEIRDSLKK
ncbi:MAG TPA: large conductance mechanosensitive channel protein MscL [Bacteroidia bacterium]|jgi:large conductance mechanosensitive channel|nr:large conductance mechanosensitive channel protein MscL [Bacteroidia bacterium]